MKKYIIAATVIVLSIVTSVWLMFAQRKRESIYVGEKVCRQCHHLAGNRDQFNPWRLSQHADAYAALFKSEAKPIADLSGIDIKPHQSPICLGCHTTACYVEDWERGDDFRFEDDWYDETDRDGHSLEVVDPFDTDPNDYGDQNAWHASEDVGGSPGFGAGQ